MTLLQPSPSLPRLMGQPVFEEVVMRLRFLTLRLGLLGTLAACSGSQSPVPMVGRQADISQLAGEWLGEYSSVESGRSGTIVFTLTAGSDTASGDVVMTPQFVTRGPAAQTGQPPTPPQTPRAITIKFVRVSGGQVSGALDPYPDPTCGCQLHTTFIGRLVGDTLSGTYRSRHIETQEIQQGRWRVVRKAAQ